MESNNNNNNYLTDLSNLISEVKVAKTAVNPHFKNAYAPLDAWLDAVHTLCPKHNFVVFESTEYLDSANGLYLVHKIELNHIPTNAVYSSRYPVCCVDEKPQAIGSALTYARRYHFQCVLNATGETDDDGTQAQAMSTPRTPVAMKRKLAWHPHMNLL